MPSRGYDPVEGSRILAERRDAPPLERVDDAHGEWDEDGFRLRLDTDRGHRLFLIAGVAVARALVAAADDLRDWVDEHDRELAAYRRATPEERDAVLGRAPDDDDARESHA